jgi:Tfp pilus assembly PilM family ATPase
MAARIRNCLGIDIGSQWVRIAHMEMGKSGPRVLALIEKELDQTAGQNEAQRNQSISKQLQDLLKEHKIRTKQAVFSVPGQTVFVRQFPLPNASPDRLKKMVGFEARQRVPFPLDKTIMEYQVFEGSNPNEVSVLLVAIKKEFVLNFMRLIRRTGLTPLAISVSSIALYNYHEVSTSTRELAPVAKKKATKEKGKTAKEKKKGKGGLFGRKKKGAEGPEETEDELPDGLEGLDEDAPLDEMGFEEIQAYVNLGASLMDLAIPSPGPSRMIGFTRSVPLAGNEMDRAIRDKAGLEDIGQARAIKEREAVILATDHEIDGDPDSVNMSASEAATAIADRIIGELRRSLDYYISQPDGVAVDNIVLSGGLARMRFLAGYISEKMGVPVSIAEPQGERLRMPDNAPDSFAPFALAVGLALQGLEVAQNTINFLPEEIKRIRNVGARRYELIGMSAMLVAIIGMSWDVGSGQIAQYRRQVAILNDTMANATKDNAELTRAKDRDAKVVQAYEQLAQASGSQDYWLDFLRRFMEHRPPEILIDQIICRLDGNVVVRGKSPNLDSVNQFLAGLKTMSEGMVSATPDNPAGALPVELNNYVPVRDPRYGREVQSFEITVKSLVRLGRIRGFGQLPVAGPPRPATPGQQPGFGRAQR